MHSRELKYACSWDALLAHYLHKTLFNVICRVWIMQRKKRFNPRQWSSVEGRQSDLRNGDGEREKLMNFAIFTFFGRDSVICSTSIPSDIFSGFVLLNSKFQNQRSFYEWLGWCQYIQYAIIFSLIHFTAITWINRQADETNLNIYVLIFFLRSFWTR